MVSDFYKFLHTDNNTWLVLKNKPVYQRWANHVHTIIFSYKKILLEIIDFSAVYYDNKLMLCFGVKVTEYDLDFIRQEIFNALEKLRGYAPKVIKKLKERTYIYYTWY